MDARLRLPAKSTGFAGWLWAANRLAFALVTLLVRYGYSYTGLRHLCRKPPGYALVVFSLRSLQFATQGMPLKGTHSCPIHGIPPPAFNLWERGNAARRPLVINWHSQTAPGFASARDPGG